MITAENPNFPSFSIVTFDTSDSWETMLLLAWPHLDSPGLDRLRNVLDDNCGAVVIERHYIDRDYRDTFSHFHSKRFTTPDSRCVRLHFFSAPVTEDSIVAGDSSVSETYLGYSVIRPTKPNCVGRTLLTHRLRLGQDAHLSVCRERVHLLGTPIEVEGFPFISQDGDATVCAESALWMLLRYYSNRYPNYAEILPFQITSLSKQQAGGGRIYPSAGLFSWQLTEALRLRGFSPVVYSRRQFAATFDHLLYTYIESGLPLLVTVPDHVVVAVGHRSDYTAPWLGGTERLFTSDLNRSFVIHDDNHFPYQMLTEMGPENPSESEYPWAEIEEFIVPLPEKVFLTAEQAQTAIETVLDNPKVGLSRSSELAGKELIFRLFLTSAQSFKRNLRIRKMGNPVVEWVYRQLPMPHFIWVCEISEYAEYCASSKVKGEIIWDATRNAKEPDGWIALHLPESLSFDLGAAYNRPQDIKEIHLKDHQSYSLFTSNLHTL